jgi:hypothetical protein
MQAIGWVIGGEWSDRDRAWLRKYAWSRRLHAGHAEGSARGTAHAHGLPGLAANVVINRGKLVANTARHVFNGSV